MTVFTRLLTLPASAFLVFLNAFSPVGPGVVPPIGGPLVVPVPGDQTTLATLPKEIRNIPIPEGTPVPLPTNAWWSSGALDTWPAPIFSYPIVTTIGTDGVSVGLAEPVVAPTAVMSALQESVKLIPRGIAPADARVARWGDWDVTWNVRDQAKQTIMEVTAVQGSPFLFVKPFHREVMVQFPPGSKAQVVSCSGGCEKAVIVAAPKERYVIAFPRDAMIYLDALSVTASFPSSSSLMSIGVVADGDDPAKYLPFSLRSLAGTFATYSVKPDSVETTFHFPAETLVGILPHQAKYLVEGSSERFGSFQTVRGKVQLMKTSVFTTRLPRPPILPALPLASSLVKDKSFLTRLQGEIEAINPITPASSYTGGKHVLKMSHLADLADQIQHPLLLTQARAKLHDMVKQWCTATPGERERVLAYDSALGGIVQLTPAFGSEHYNDHHFHAGYLLQAGATLARIDPTFQSEFGDCMEFLIRDIASPNRSDPSFPYLRHFDVYAGHSWANGLTRFADGQNQESTSEALQAWSAIAQWGRATENRSLEDLGTWLLAEEAAGTRAYWFNANSDVPTLPTTFTHPMISILWGGKVDYATFFDAHPSAIHGIQFFPVTTALLPSVTTTILDRLVSPIIPQTGNTIWKTNLKLAAALSGKPTKITGTETIDEVYTQVYVDHWMAALTELGRYEAEIEPSHSCGAVFSIGGVRSAVIYRYAGDLPSCTFTDSRTRQRWTVGELGLGWNVREL
jgi:hypothetical protein